MNPNHIDLPGTPVELEGEIIGYVENTNKVMSEVNPNYNPQDPFGNRWEKHPSAVENQIKEDSPWDVPTTNGKPNYDPSTGEKNPYLREEETIKYGLTATEIVKKEYPHIYAGYMAIVEEQLELFSRKHLDYGMHNITAGTSLATEDEREFALTGLWYRISDKVNRWKNLIISSRVPNNETIIDTFQDIVNYGIIAQLVEKNQWKN